MRKILYWLVVFLGSFFIISNYVQGNTSTFIICFISTLLFVLLVSDEKEILLSESELNNLKHLQFTKAEGNYHFGHYCKNFYGHKEFTPKMTPHEYGWECSECGYKERYTKFEKQLANWGVYDPPTPNKTEKSNNTNQTETSE